MRPGPATISPRPGVIPGPVLNPYHHNEYGKQQQQHGSGGHSQQDGNNERDPYAMNQHLKVRALDVDEDGNGCVSASLIDMLADEQCLCRITVPLWRESSKIHRCVWRSFSYSSFGRYLQLS